MTHDDALREAVEHFHANRLVDAESICRKVLQENPAQPHALHLLGKIALRCNHAQAGAKLIERAASAFNDRGAELNLSGDISGAEAAYRLAIELNPNLVNALTNLANNLRDQAQLDESIALSRRAMESDPHDREAWRSLLYAMHLRGTDTPESILRQNRQWATRNADALAQNSSWPNTREPDRRLRVGYVSRDLNGQPVGQFLLPLLERHDRSQFEVTCYSDTPQEDETTCLLRAAARTWHSISHLDDASVAALIQRDEIDILVDLEGHTFGNRLLVFARRPAPVQVSWLGYPGTTGLTTIDYRITDAQADPPGETETFHTEQLHRLDQAFLCYRAPAQAPPVGESCAGRDQCVTFGSFNYLAKLAPSTLRLWARILSAVAGSKLLIKSPVLVDSGVRKRFWEMAAQHGIAGDRLNLLGYERSVRGHFEQYSRVDIALDPIAYNGTTTTWGKMWMGVPVISLAGRTHASRVGVSLLTHARKSEWIAKDQDEYVALASGLAADSESRKQIRHTLREQLQSSPLMDETAFASSMERAYRKMWNAWCATSPAP